MEENEMRKITALALSLVLAMGCMTGCGSSGKKEGFDSSSEISVVSREEGSGTRGAFVELTGIESDDVDNTTVDASITNSTSVMMTSVSGNNYAIGYVSLGSMNDTIKAVKVDGVKATSDNINNGTYKISRPFNIVTKGDVSKVAKDFINYILSEEGQKVISDNKYIEVGNTGAFTSTEAAGKIVVAGSSSVTPVMEKLVEAYKAINANAEIEVQESDSTTGVNSAVDGTCDIGMASRNLKESEAALGLTETTIAMDGIAVIVNKNNTVESLTVDQIKAIFCGEVLTWDEVE